MTAPKARGRRGSAVHAGSTVHRGLVGARELVGTPYLADAELRDEYARDIAPRTEAAMGRVLDEVWGAVGVGLPMRAIDLGAGTGAVGRVLRARCGEALELVEVDRTPGPGVLRANLAVELPPVDGRFDLVVAAHLLNELFVQRPDRVSLRAQRVLAWSRSLLAPGGLLILVEPALRETSRDLLAVRDQVLAAGLHVVAPCFWTGPCPALARDRDWCHSSVGPSRGPTPPAMGSDEHSSSSLRRSPVHGKRVDFSYLVVAREREPLPPLPLYRVVSDPLPEKGRLRLFVCGPDGRHQAIRLSRHHSTANEALDGVVRGDAVSIANGSSSDDGLRVTEETLVAKVRR